MQDNAKFQLLLIEHNLVEIKLLQELLQHSKNPEFEVFHARTFQEAIQQIKHTHFDIALVDTMVPDSQTLGFLHHLKQKNIPLPSLLLIDTIDENFINNAREENVQDYILKYEINHVNLVTTIHHIISRAQIDTITTTHIQNSNPEKNIGLRPQQYAKTLFNEHLQFEINRAQQFPRLIALMFVYIENFSGLYSNYGSVTAEAFKSAYADKLMKILRANDVIERYSENEFGCVLVDLANEQDVNFVINKVITSLNEPIHINSHTISVKTKLGLALYPKNSADSQDLIRCAYSALTCAKKQAGTTYELYNSCISPLIIEHLKVAEAVRHSIEERQLQLQFQPVVSLPNKNIIAADVQIYWQHPEYSEVTSKDFMFLAELGGLILPITECVLRKACEQYSIWMSHGHKPERMRIHIPSILLQKNYFPQMLKTILAETDVLAEVLELTVPLSAIRLNSEKVKLIMISLDAMGVGLLLDDFGSSNTSLQIIETYPIKGVVINKNLVDRIPEDADAKILFKTILGLCQSMKLSVTAEGIEIPKQEMMLMQWCCDEVQGALYNKPVDAEIFLELMIADSSQNLNRSDSTVKELKSDNKPFIKRYIESLNFLPPMHTTVEQLLHLRNNPDLNVTELSIVLLQDPAIAAQIMRYANAPFFGNQGKIKTIEQAVMTALGLEGALNMATGIALMGGVQSCRNDCLDLQAFWLHAVFSATLSQSIAKLLPAGTVIPGTAFLAGLLQNIGYLVLCKDFHSQIKQARDELRHNPELIITEVEKQIIGTNHVEVGLYLLRNWHLPEEIVTAIFEHHNTSYVGPHAIYPNIVLMANRLLAPARLGDETVSYIPPAMLQINALQETQLIKIVTKVMHQRDELNAISKHLAA